MRQIKHLWKWWLSSRDSWRMVSYYSPMAGVCSALIG